MEIFYILLSLLLFIVTGLGAYVSFNVIKKYMVAGTIILVLTIVNGIYAVILISNI